MTNSLFHRGPDGSGFWFEPGNGIGLGHRRLAIVDLSASGRQPMTSRSGRYITVFNGEIYNFQRLRAELALSGATFIGHSDTEVMLAAFEQWGIESSVRRFIGMFAIALWDTVDRILYLIRDRLGKKPIYYGVVRGSLIFGSELKALTRFPGFDAFVDRQALSLFLRHNYVPCPWSIYQGIKKLPPGTILAVCQRRQGHDVQAPVPYWTVAQLFDQGGAVPLPDSAAIETCEALLRDAVRLRMIADVPLGAFLSGGTDSSLIVALMQDESSRPVRTFTIGFHEEFFDEAPQARAVAQHLGTDHTEVYLTPADARAVIPQLPSMFDEPFSDSSQIPTFLVSQVARRSVTVALSGDGGDELFCGYDRYLRWRRVWGNMRRMPQGARRALAQGLTTVSTHRWDQLLVPCMRMLPRTMRLPSPGDKLHKLSRILTTEDPGAVYLPFVSHWLQPASIVVGGREPETLLNRGGGPCELDRYTQQMMKLDVLTYLPDDILVKVDRASMAVSLEARAPMLDHRVCELAASLPLSQKLRGSTRKWILKRILGKYVPAKLTDRPKMGFGVPIDSWLRGPLREWAEDLLDERRLREDGYFDPKPIRALWNAHLAHERDGHYLLWDVIMFQAWVRDIHRPCALRAA